MKLSQLKKIRVAVSVLFFIMLSLLFLDLKNIISPIYTNYITYLQFIPSLLKYLNLFSLAAAGFIIVLILTLLFGRVYCSSICPIGTLQDIFSFIAKKINKKKYFRLLNPNDWLRYSFLALAVIFFLSGSLFAINLLDPYSNFGRIFTQLFKPVIVGGNNLLVLLLEQFKNYSVYPLEIKTPDLGLLSFPLFFLAIIFWMSYKNGRQFCNTVCPVGTLLGLISRISLFKIKIDEENCIGCNLCERVCKSGCIDKKNKYVDFSRCVSCYNCFAVCPSEGICFSTVFEKPSKVETSEVDYKKREFVAGIIAYTIGSAGIAFAQQKITPTKLSTVQNLKKYPVAPPGSISIDHFTDSCTACNLCVSACPTKVLQPSFLDYGFLGMLQPKMDYSVSFCNFECVICSQVCPTGAILPIKPEKKKLTQIGKVKFVKENCVVHTEKTDCGACAEHCPTKAVHMVPFENIKAPEIQTEYCIGCGACEYACPTKPYKAIYVEGNPRQLTAKKKEEKKIENKVNIEEDFPF